MTNHPNRSKRPLSYQGFVIQLANGRLWKPLHASDAAIFATHEAAFRTMQGFSGRGALANPKVMRVTSACESGARKVDGYYLAEV